MMTTEEVEDLSNGRRTCENDELLQMNKLGLNQKTKNKIISKNLFKHKS